jgi:hypothetical protein
MTEPTPVDNLCAMCERPGEQACAGCHAIRYCSQLCQKADWPLHKLLCKTYKNFDDKIRPKAHDNCIYKRAIHFSESGNAPRFVWVRFHGPSSQGSAKVDTEFISPECKMLPPIKEIMRSLVLNRPLFRSIWVAGHHWPRSADDILHARKENKSLLKVDKELSEWFHGHLVAFGHNGATNPTAPGGIATTAPWYDQPYDLTPLDLRHIVDRMRAEHFVSGREFKIYQEGSVEKVKGVRMNCHGDHKICQEPTRVNVDVAKALCSQNSDLPSPLADKIGVALIIRKLPNTLAWRGRHFEDLPCATHPALGFLDLQTSYNRFREANYTQEFFKIALQLDEEAGDVGSCVVVRKDGKPLDNKFMHGLERYAFAKLMKVATGSKPKDIMTTVSKKDWEEFYAKFLQNLPAWLK